MSAEGTVEREAARGAQAPPGGDEILERLRALVRAQRGADVAVAPESSLAADLGLDSLQLLELTVELENAFRVALEPEPDAPLETVGQVVNRIARGLAELEASA
jgi:acyl carrier protein